MCIILQDMTQASVKYAQIFAQNAFGNFPKIFPIMLVIYPIMLMYTKYITITLVQIVSNSFCCHMVGHLEKQFTKNYNKTQDTITKCRHSRQAYYALNYAGIFDWDLM